MSCFFSHNKSSKGSECDSGDCGRNCHIVQPNVSAFDGHGDSVVSSRASYAVGGEIGVLVVTGLDGFGVFCRDGCRCSEHGPVDSFSARRSGQATVVAVEFTEGERVNERLDRDILHRGSTCWNRCIILEVLHSIKESFTSSKFDEAFILGITFLVFAVGLFEPDSEDSILVGVLVCSVKVNVVDETVDGEVDNVHFSNERSSIEGVL